MEWNPQSPPRMAVSADHVSYNNSARKEIERESREKTDIFTNIRLLC